MKRCFALLSCFIMAKGIAYTQLVNNGATITVANGATIKCTGNIINNGGGTIQNSGIVSSDGEIRNEATGILGGTTGVYEATTKFVNNGAAFTGLKLRLIGNSNTDSIKSGAGSTYDSVILAKGEGTTATLSDAMTVNGGILFNNDNNKLVLEDENLIMGVSAKFANPDNNQFVITNNAGTVTKQNLGPTTSPAAFVYPIGFSATEFNPLSVSNSGTADNIAVRCMQNVLTNGSTGSVVTTDFVNNSWVVTEGVGGGSNLTLTGEWVAGDEAGGSTFNRVKSGIARWNTSTDWDLPASNVIAASGSGSGPFNTTRAGITSAGVFAIADLDRVNAARLSLKIFLQGAYNGTTLIMNDGLRSAGLIPTTQPYSTALNAKFTRVGIYDGTTSVNEAVPSATKFDLLPGPNDDIVDWVYLSSLDPATPSTKLQTRAALLQRDGDIVEYDPVGDTYVPVRMPIDADGNYHILVSHRNHLSVRTSSALSLTDNVTLPYSFTTAQAQAFQNPAYTATNNAMTQNGSVFLMWGGNANMDSTVRVTTLFTTTGDPVYILGSVLLGNSSTVLNNVYLPADVTMDGTVRINTLFTTTGEIPFIVGSVVGGDPNAQRKEHK